MGSRALALALVLLAPATAWAHGGVVHEDTAERAWQLATALTLLAVTLAYTYGLTRQRGRGAPITRGRAIAFFAGIAVLVLALLSPLDALSDVRFSAHMGQHELLVLLAAPLIVVGRPELAWRAALPADGRRTLGRVLHAPPIASTLRILGDRWVVVVLHALAVWIWHAPVLFEAALRDEGIHALQHLTFFATAALFWWAMVRGRYGRLGYGLAVVFVFVTALHKGLLAALFTVAGRTFYPTHVARTEAAGGDALADQELAGLVMWVPAGVLTAGLAVALFVAWMGALERRTDARAP